MLTVADVSGRSLQPLSELLSADVVPADLAEFASPLSSLFDQFYYCEASLHPVPNGYLGSVLVVLDQEFVVAPFGDALQLVLGGTQGVTLFRIEVGLEFRPGGFSFSLGLLDTPITLRVGTGILRPLLPGTNTPDPDATSLDIILGAANLRIGTDQPFEVEFTGSIALPRSMVGDTGVIVEAEEIRWLTPGYEDLPPNTPDGFVGMYVDNAAISHVDMEFDNPPLLAADYLFLGSGGVTSAIDAAGLQLTGSLLGFEFTLETLGAEFVQSAITASEIGGLLTVPFFDAPFTLEARVSTSGGFHATLGQADDDGLLEVPIPGLGTLTLASIGFVDDDQGTAVLISGTLLLTVLSPPLQWPLITLEDLRIDADGSVQLPNGWIDLQEPAGFSLFGFGFEMTRIGFGSLDDGRRWVGFSGGLQLLPFLPTGVSVEGLRIIWNPAAPGSPPELTLQGVGLEMTVPGVINFGGDVALITEGDDRFFKGNARLEIMPIGLFLDASIKVGRNLAEDYTYFYTFMDLTLPIGIPLFTTGAAIYGFAGLYGMNVGPSVEGSDWYGWYSGLPAAFNVTNSGKWIGAEDGKALGAGMTIGTLFDTGRVVSAKGLFALVLPGPVIILHGMANFLETPPDPDDPASQGVFNMLAVLDMLAGSIQLNIDAGWSQANVLDIAASAEAYFDFANPANWHFYLGKDEPVSQRIRAYMLSLFQADAYLMIDRDGIATGASVSWGMDWKFGPVKVVLRSWIGGDAEITWQPAQFEGSLYVGGEFEVSVAGFGIGLGAEAELSGAAPTSYCVRGTLYLRVKLPMPIKDLEEDILLEWKEEKVPAREDPFSSIGIEHQKVDETWTTLPPDVLQNDSPGAPGYDPGPIVPLDAQPAVVFDRAMKDETTGIELNNPDGFDGEYKSTKIDSYTFDYSLEDVKLEKWSKAGGTGWVAVDDLFGTWVAIEDANGESAASKLQLWTTSPFAFTRQSSRTYSDAFLANRTNWPCRPVDEPETICVNWDSIDAGSAFGQNFTWRDLQFTLVLSDTAGVVNNGIDGPCSTTNTALLIPGSYVVCWIIFPEPVRNLELCLGGEFAVLKAFANGRFLEHIVDPDEGRVAFAAEGIDSLALWSLDDGEIAEICYQTEAAAAAHSSAQEYMDRVIASTARWESEQPILEPETWYRLSVTNETSRTKNGVAEPESWTHYGYFQTAGPPGLTPDWARDGDAAEEADPADNTTLPYPDGGLLTSLLPFISETIPSDGRQPVYRGYDLGAEFNEDYVEQMYGADMAIRLLDSNGNPVVDAEGNELVFPNLWADQPTGELSETEIPYTTRIEDCLELPPIGVSPNQKVLFSNGVLLEEDFSGELDQWTDPSGAQTSDWQISGGVLVYAGTVFSTLGALLVAGEPEWGDYAVEVNLGDEGDEVGLVFRYTGPGAAAYYRLRLTPTERFLEKISETEITILWQEGIGYVPGQNGTLAIQCLGGRLRGQLDDVLLFDLEDDEPLLTGQVGIYTNTNAAFSHFLVREWPGGPLAPRTVYSAELMASFVLFDGGLLSGWTDPAHSWEQFVNNNAHITTIGREVWDDSRLEVNLDTSGGNAGVIARFNKNADGTFSCYRVILNPNNESIKLARLEGNWSGGTYDIPSSGRNVLWECSGSACGLDFQAHQHDVALTCAGESLTLEIDGETVCEIRDAGGLAQGLSGLYFNGDPEADAQFTDLVIRSAPRKPVHHWQFTTSQFAGLVEHLDSFAGMVYDETAADSVATDLPDVVADAVPVISDARYNQFYSRADLAAAGPSELTATRDGARIATQEVHEASSRYFGELYALFFGEQYRALPPVVELTQVISFGARVAFLLESPEPLDWARLTVTLSRFRPRRDAFVELDEPLIVWSEDGTRAILTRTDSKTLLPGKYRLLLRFDLDIGQEAPLLRRGGSVLPELARLEYEVE